MKKISYDSFINLYNQGLNDSSIARILGSSTSTIFAKRKAKKLPRNIPEKKVNNEKLKELHLLNYTDRELSKYFNCPNQWISIKRRKLDLIENKSSSLIKELTNEEEEILLGLILGDGRLIKTSSTKRAGTSGSVVHGLSQKEYIEWLNLKLKRISTNIRLETNFNKNRNCIEKRYAFGINTHLCLNKYYDLFYDSLKVKHLYSSIVQRLTPLSLAVWFMDDGSKTSSGGYYLCTNCFKIEEQKVAISILEKKFNLQITLHKTIKDAYIMYISAKSAKQFEFIISPYIIPSMIYKLHNKVYKYKKFAEFYNNQQIELVNKQKRETET